MEQSQIATEATYVFIFGMVMPGHNAVKILMVKMAAFPAEKRIQATLQIV